LEAVLKTDIAVSLRQQIHRSIFRCYEILDALEGL
jgi:hypothetical protein